MKHVGIKIKFYNLDTFKKQTDVNFIDLDSELVDLNYKVASLIFCYFWRSILSLKPEQFGGIANVFGFKSEWHKNFDGFHKTTCGFLSHPKANITKFGDFYWGDQL